MGFQKICWDFLGNVLGFEQIHENNDALIKYNYGNSIFAIVSGSFFLVLIIITFFTNKVIIDHEKFFRFGIRPRLLKKTPYVDVNVKLIKVILSYAYLIEYNSFIIIR